MLAARLLYVGYVVSAFDGGDFYAAPRGKDTFFMPPGSGPISDVITVSETECSIACSRDPGCFGFDFGVASGRCRTVGAHGMLGQIEYSPGTVYYQRQDQVYCPTHFSPHTDRSPACYYVDPFQRPLGDASSLCAARDASRLVSVESAAELGVIREHVKNKGLTFWTSGAKVADGSYSWENHVTVNASSTWWAAGEPSRGAGESTVILKGVFGTDQYYLEDHDPATGNAATICEHPGSFTPFG